MSATGAAETASTPSKTLKQRGVNRPKDRPGPFEQLRAILDQPTLWEFVATIPEQASEGARRKLPTIFYVAMPSFAAVFGSFSAAESALAEDETWRPLCSFVCDTQAKYRPGDKAFDVEELQAGRRLTAQNFYDARRSWLGEHLTRLAEVFEAAAADVAREVGHADPDGPGSANSLTRSRTLIGDGKVTREPGSRYQALAKHEVENLAGVSVATHVRDGRTGEIVASADMEGDAHLYMTGGGPVVGFKTVRLALREDETNSTVILSVRRPESKDEAACAVQAAHDVKTRLPGVLGLSYDTALRGKHIRELAKTSRLVTIAPVAAKENAAGKRRIEKTGFVAEVAHHRRDGILCVHRFHHRAGQLCEERLDEKGAAHLEPLPDPVIRFRDNKRDHRMYLEWAVTCQRGMPTAAGPQHVETLSWTVTQDNPAFNVAENLRAVPPASGKYAEAHGWRQSVENDNHQSDSRKHLRRGRSSRPDWNQVNEIGWAIMQNGIALRRHRARTTAAVSDVPASAAA